MNKKQEEKNLVLTNSDIEKLLYALRFYRSQFNLSADVDEAYRLLADKVARCAL